MTLNNLSKKILFLAVLFNEPRKKADAIICMEGDGVSRADKAIKLFNKKIAGTIVISGNYDAPPFSVPADELETYLIKKGIPRQKIILEKTSKNTHEQAREVMGIVKKEKWNRIILVASHFHQPRAYLTFLKTMKDLGLNIHIDNAPVRELPWFKETSLGITRVALLEKEFEKMDEYKKNGHIATFDSAIAYQEWKERAR